MGRPTPSDPLGLKDPREDFAKGLEQLISETVRRELRGKTGERFDDCSDIQLVSELLARGWAVFKPTYKVDG